MRLQTVNPHPKDKDIYLDRTNHTYIVKGQTSPLTSVTTLIESYLKPVQAEDILDKHYANWQSDPDKRPDLYGCSRMEIALRWKKSACHQAALGTLLHRSIERYYNGMRPLYAKELTAEWEQFQTFQAECNPGAYRSEMPLYSDMHQVGGTVDMIADNSDNTFTLYDWKRTKHDLYSCYAGQGAKEYGHYPLQSIPNNKAGRHAMQLNLYRAIVETQYGMRVKGMFIVRFHSSLNSYQCRQIPRLVEAERLLDYHSSRLNLTPGRP
jgi:hypothetical protein